MHGMFVLPLLSASHPIFNNPRGKASDFFFLLLARRWLLIKGALIALLKNINYQRGEGRDILPF